MDKHNGALHLVLLQRYVKIYVKKVAGVVIKASASKNQVSFVNYSICG